MTGCRSCGAPTPNRKCRDCRLMERAEEAAQDAKRESEDDDDDDGDAAPAIVTDGGDKRLDTQSGFRIPDDYPVGRSAIVDRFADRPHVTAAEPCGPGVLAHTTASAHAFTDLLERCGWYPAHIDEDTATILVVPLPERVLGRDPEQHVECWSGLAEAFDKDGDAL